MKHLNMQMAGLRVAVQGCGNVGAIAGYLLQDLGAKIVAISDSRGGIYNPKSLEVRDVLRHKGESGSVIGYLGAEGITNAELLTVDCDVLVPSALEHQITGENAGQVKARIVAEGANGPTTPEADAIFEARKIFVIPDILCDAGGVTVSYFEWVQGLQFFFWQEAAINEQLRTIMERSFDEVLETAEEKQVHMYTAVYIRAV